LALRALTSHPLTAPRLQGLAADPGARVRRRHRHLLALAKTFLSLVPLIWRSCNALD
jgi:hypothetical protein